MRSILAVVLLSACAPHASTGPDWPKQHAAASDGGESLSPHESRAVVIAVEKSEPEAKVEVAVKIAQRWLLARIRDEVFHSLGRAQRAAAR